MRAAAAQHKDMDANLNYLGQGEDADFQDAQPTQPQQACPFCHAVLFIMRDGRRCICQRCERIYGA